MVRNYVWVFFDLWNKLPGTCRTANEARLSVMLHLPGMCFALATTLSLTHLRVSALSRVMTLYDFKVVVFTAKTTAALSQWNRIFLLHSSLPQSYNDTRIGNNSSTVMSPVSPDSCHVSGHVAYDHFPAK